MVDRDDNVWAGTAQGLAKLNTTDQTWTTYTTANNLYTNAIFDIQLLGDGQIAVSTSESIPIATRISTSVKARAARDAL